ncbi:E3 ubiquitin/ISG15 ligase TRIM25-like [Hyperolius riggenbachi]|uniref:E3 ubiquitin/ISG15 ligase TRIM25-like n=1 Tax=Hyperolius riggenbachi TaxID=752182 RepID=UPI0035A2F10A
MASLDVRAELDCSICLSIYRDPVTLRCGHNFCRACIRQSLDSQYGSYSCPECRKPFLERPDLQKNITLCKIVERYLATPNLLPDQHGPEILCTICVDSPVPAVRFCLLCEACLCDTHLRSHPTSTDHILCDLTQSPGDSKCSIHNKSLEYYCTEHAAPICASCCQDRKHWGHQAEKLNKAAERKKQKLKCILQSLITRRAETEQRVQSLQEHKRKTQEKSQRMSAQIRALKMQLNDLENKVCQEAKTASLCSDNVISQLEIKKDELLSRQFHIEELCNMTDPLTVLQEPDIGDLGDNEGGHNEDRERHDGGQVDIAGILHTLQEQLSDLITGGSPGTYIPAPADLLLDINSASNYLRISDDGKNVSWSDIEFSYLVTPVRFRCEPQVMSQQKIFTGRDCWEVNVRRSQSWRIGMCYPSIARGGELSRIGDNDKSWCLIKTRDQYSVAHGSIELLLSSKLSSNRVRIYLDYEAGQISFYDLCHPVRHLHTFTATFTEPLHAVLCVWEGCLQISGQ